MKVSKDQNTPIEYNFQFIVLLVVTAVKIQNVNCIIIYTVQSPFNWTLHNTGDNRSIDRRIRFVQN